MVEILESSFVVPDHDTPRKILELSNLDLVATSKHTCSMYLFKNTKGDENFMSAEVLKATLAKALVLLYPLAGRYIIGCDGRVRIDCNAEGMLFVVARLDRTADSIQFDLMLPELRELFIPEEQPSSSLIQMLQVTYLKCGSAVLGISNSHIFIDGQAAAHFFQTWSGIARGDLDSIIPPNFDNTPLRARSPLKINFDFPEYSTDYPPEIRDTTPNSNYVLNILRLSKEAISRLKIRCSQGSKATRVTAFCAVSALIWKCYCIARELKPETKSRLFFAADVRRRLNPPLISYFGNGVVWMSAASEVLNITSNPISYVANTVKVATDQLTDENVRFFIDYVEVMRNKRISWTPILESDLRVRPLFGLALTNVDFGWGAPKLFSLEGNTKNGDFYLLNEQGQEGSIKIVAALEPSIMPLFEKAFYEELFSCWS